MLVARKFASTVEDVAASASAQASAARDLVEVLAATGASSDCDCDAASVAAGWAIRLVNSKAFFTMHPTLVF